MSKRKTWPCNPMIVQNMFSKESETRCSECGVHRQRGSEGVTSCPNEAQRDRVTVFMDWLTSEKTGELGQHIVLLLIGVAIGYLVGSIRI